MEQLFRRRLLALGTLGPTPEAVDAACRKFVDEVLAVHISRRPSFEAVWDVLLANGAPRTSARRFAAMFDRLVWDLRPV